MSLGSQLSATQTTFQQNALLALQHSLKEKERDGLAKLAAVQDFFSAAQRSFTADIEAGRPKVRPMTLGKRENLKAQTALATYSWNETTGNTVASPKHLYYPVWEAFATWCASEALVPKLNYEHDGVGMESWWVLTVEPQRPA